MRFPIVRSIPYQDPVSVFTCFKGQHDAIFLDSAELREHCGRYSFIAADPFTKLSSKNQIIRLNGKLLKGDPFALLATLLEDYRSESHLGLPPFQGGVAGYFAYDLYQHLEDIPLHTTDDMEFPDMMLGFYDVVMAFDHVLQQAWIFSSGFPHKTNAARQKYAEDRLAWFMQRLTFITPLDSVAKFTPISAFSPVTKSMYQSCVKKVIDYILDGDIFEANISHRFMGYLPENFPTFDLYRQLRAINPAPFAAYLTFDDVTLISASPERFLKLTHDQVETRPIKGTRPRGISVIEDDRYAKELLHSEKDHAENIMIVDLLRNDLSKVCADYTVQVPQLCGLESYASVHHLVSVVIGKLKPEYKALDLFKACFPGGSITGAPKVRAMEIIANIEPTARGPYCGSIGYIGFDGAMDTSIVIRTFAIKGKHLTFQVGGAVVADSNPEDEYHETLVKAAALNTIL